MSAEFLLAQARLNDLINSDDCIKICLTKDEVRQIAQEIVDRESRKKFFKKILEAIKSLFASKKDLLFEFAVAIVFYALKKRGL